MVVRVIFETMETSEEKITTVTKGYYGLLVCWD